MAEYLTEQKKMLTEILKKNADRGYSIEELISELHDLYGDAAPGKSTVYRLMTHMVEEGRVRRLSAGHGRRFVYQIIEHESCHSHLHLKCVDCGRLLHLERELTEELTSKVRAEKSFSVLKEETVLFGICADCNKGGRI